MKAGAVLRSMMLGALLRWTAGPRIEDLLARLTGRLNRDPPLGEALQALEEARGPLVELLAHHLRSDAAAGLLAAKMLNLLLADYHFRLRSEALCSQPFGLIVDPANGCNLTCPGCVHSEHSKAFQLFDWNKGMLSEERFEALLRQHGAAAVQLMFCNYGEPTINPKAPRMIAMANSYLIQTALSTNLALPRFDAEAYVESGLDFMVLSIDGVTQPVYEQFRRNGKIDVVFENVRKLVAAKIRMGRRTPILRWQYLAFEHNRHEIPAALRKANALGVDQFSVETPFDVSWDAAGVRVARSVPAASHELTLDTEAALGQAFRRKVSGCLGGGASAGGWAAHPGNEVRGSPARHTCAWLYKNMAMDANGRILPCCGAPQKDLRLEYAKFPEEVDCFNSSDYRRVRGHFARGAGDLPEGIVPHCEKCEWDHSDALIGREQVAVYLRAAGVSTGAIRMLAGW